jgi:hypothetical protein
MTSEAPKDLLEFAAKWATPVGVVILLLLQGQFISRKEFSDASEKLSGRVENIEKVLVQMAEAAKQNDRQDTQISDHERRIRQIEMGK